MGFFRCQYAESDNSICSECDDAIQTGDVQAKCNFEGPYPQVYHFQCLIDTCSFDGRRKEDIEIVLEKGPDKSLRRILKYVSLEAYDQNPYDYKLGISEEDVSRIREQIALAKDHKTAYYIPEASKTREVIKCPKKYCIHDPSNSASDDEGEEKLQLDFQEYYYHPICLANSGQVNVNGNEIIYYNSLTDDYKQLLDDLFKKDNESYNFPKAESTSVDVEYCSYSKCLESRTAPIKGLRIRYQTKVYHPHCFNKMGVVNIDGKEFGNCDLLSKKYKAYLDKHFIRTDEFGIPHVEEADRDDYCSAEECIYATESSKFPYAYTIKKNHLQIIFQGCYYHPRCLKATGKIDNMAARDFYGYNDISNKRKLYLDELFMENDDVVDESLVENGGSNNSNSDVTADAVDNDDDTGGPPAKRARLSDQMEVNNDASETIEVNNHASETNQMQDEYDSEDGMEDEFAEVSFDDIQPNDQEVEEMDVGETLNQLGNTEIGRDNDNNAQRTVAQLGELQGLEHDNTLPSNNEMQSILIESNSNAQSTVTSEEIATDMNLLLSTPLENVETQSTDTTSNGQTQNDITVNSKELTTYMPSTSMMTSVEMEEYDSNVESTDEDVEEDDTLPPPPPLSNQSYDMMILFCMKMMNLVMAMICMYVTFAFWNHA